MKNTYYIHMNASGVNNDQIFAVKNKDLFMIYHQGWNAVVRS